MDFLDFLVDDGWTKDGDNSSSFSSATSLKDLDTSCSDYDGEDSEVDSDGNPFPKLDGEDDLLLDVERKKAAASTSSSGCSVSEEDAAILSKVQQLKVVPLERGEVDNTINRWYHKNFNLFPPGFVFRPMGRVDGVMMFGARCIKCSVPPEKNYVFVKDAKDLVKLKHFIRKHIATEMKRQRSLTAASQYITAMT